jgi:hypothetical protein
LLGALSATPLLPPPYHPLPLLCHPLPPFRASGNVSAQLEVVDDLLTRTLEAQVC